MGCVILILTNLKKMKKCYPTFLDKSSNSNFTKHLEVINSQQLDLYQSVHKLGLSELLNRPITIKKTQNAPYNFTLEFNVTLEHLKTVTIYKDSNVIYNEEFTSEDVSNFSYTLEDTSSNVVPTEKYYIDITTFDEYHFQKGYPENDIDQDNFYDHDKALDVIGNMLNIKRHQFTVPTESEYYRTLPPYHNKTSEDDFYYMERIKYYRNNYNKIYFPILEIWKYYNIETSLINRYTIISVQNDSYMSPLLLDEANFELNFEYNKIQDSYFNVSSNGNFTLPYDLDVASNTMYYVQVKIHESESDVYFKIYYFDSDGDAIHVTEQSHISTNTPLIFYFYDTTPINAATARIILKSDSNFIFSDLRFQKVGAVNTVEDAKYMRTKTDYNSCVYDLFGDYSDVPSNLSLPSGDELLSVINRSIPITKKCFFNLNYNPESNQELNIIPSYSLEFNDLLDDNLIMDNFNYFKTFITSTIIPIDLAIVNGYTIESNILTASETGATATSNTLNINPLIKVESDAIGIKFQILENNEVIFETTDSNFSLPENLDCTFANLKIISTSETSTLSYIHLYTFKQFSNNDFGVTTLISEYNSTETSEALETANFAEYNLIKIFAESNELYEIKTSEDNENWKTLRIHERLPLIISTNECEKYLKINGLKNYKIYGVKTG